MKRLTTCLTLLTAVLSACDPGYWLANADGPSVGGVVRYPRAGYQLEVPAELHGLSGESWLAPTFSLSRITDTVRIEAASLRARGREYEADPLSAEKNMIAPGPGIRPVGLNWHFTSQGVSSVVGDSCVFVLLVRVGSSPVDSISVRYRTQ